MIKVTKIGTILPRVGKMGDGTGFIFEGWKYEATNKESLAEVARYLVFEFIQVLLKDCDKVNTFKD